MSIDLKESLNFPGLIFSVTAIEIKIRGMADESFDYDDDQTTTDQDYLVKHQIPTNFYIKI